MPDPTPLQRALSERYTILRELGAGGMATVFLAEDLRHRRKVAIKVLHPELSAVIGSDRFLKEIELTANLQHPHILPLFDSGDVNGQLFYVMPFVDGETLRSRLDREQQLPVGDAVRIAREVADALAYAHKRSVVHRDIKPENILLQDGHALVADFGIALAVQQAGAGRLTQTGLSLGTPQYMSPEQAMGERSVDHRADIYALGAVTYEMLAGEPPFTGPTAQAIIARAMTERPRSLAGVREALPLAVNNAVMTALAKLPADRFSTAGEFSDALTREGTKALESHSAQSSRRRWLPWVALASGLLLGALAMLSLRPPVNVTATDTPPQFWSVALPNNAPFDVGSDPYNSLVRSIGISPDGRTIVWRASTDSVATLWQARTDLGLITQIKGTTNGILPTFSADGRYLAFVVDSVVHRVDLSDGSIRQMAVSSNIDELAWPQADSLIANNFNGCLTSASTNGGRFRSYPIRPCARAIGGAHFRGPGLVILSNGGIIGIFDPKSRITRNVLAAGATDTTRADAVVEGDSPFLVGERLLMFMRDSTLWAAPIDLAAGKLTGESRQVLSGIRRENWSGTQLAASANGTLVWVSGGDGGMTRFVLVSPAGGQPEIIPIPTTRVTSYALSHDGQRLAYSVDLPRNQSVLRVLDRRRGVVDSLRFPIKAEVNDWVDGDMGITMLLPQVTSGHRYVLVQGGGAAMKVDSSSAAFMASSSDGKTRCANTGTFWPTAAPADTVRVDGYLDWCRFSPDGRFLSWNTSDGIFVAPADRSAPTAKRKVAPAGADEGRWSRDGREVMYRAGGRWFSVPAQPPANGVMTSPRLVFTGTYGQARASWDMAPDGRFLLLQGELPPRARHLNVITNFPRYVEEKLKTAPR